MRKRDHFQAFQKKRYATRRFQNPYFQHAQPRPWKAMLLGAAAILTVVASVWFFFRTPTFALNDVEVDGTQSIDPAQISSLAIDYLNHSRFLVFRQSNFFLFDKAGLEEALHGRYAFEELTITRDKKTLRIHVKEKTSQLIWKTGETHYLVDLQGIVIRPLTDAEKTAVYAPPPAGPVAPTEEGQAATPVQVDPLTLLPRVKDVNNATVTIGQSVLTPEEIQGLLAFQDRVRTLAIPFSETWIDRVAGKWVSLKTDAGYDILFDPTGDIDLQISNLDITLKNTIKDATNLSYIDLRFDDHVYYKFR